MNIPITNVKSYPFLFGAGSIICSSEHLYTISAVLNVSGTKVLFVTDGGEIQKIDAKTTTLDGFPVMSISDEGIVILRFGMLKKYCISTPANVH